MELVLTLCLLLIYIYVIGYAIYVIIDYILEVLTLFNLSAAQGSALLYLFINLEKLQQKKIYYCSTYTYS